MMKIHIAEYCRRQGSVVNETMRLSQTLQCFKYRSQKRPGHGFAASNMTLHGAAEMYNDESCQFIEVCFIAQFSTFLSVYTLQILCNNVACIEIAISVI